MLCKIRGNQIEITCSRYDICSLIAAVAIHAHHISLYITGYCPVKMLSGKTLNRWIPQGCRAYLCKSVRCAIYIPIRSAHQTCFKITQSILDNSLLQAYLLLTKLPDIW